VGDARIAVVSHCPPNPPWSGERRRIAAVRSHLAERYECEMLVCARSDKLHRRVARKLRSPLAPPYASRFSLPGTRSLQGCEFIWVYELWALSCIPQRYWERVLWDKDTFMGRNYTPRNPRGSVMGAWISRYERYAFSRVRHVFLSLASDVAELGLGNVSFLPHGYDPPKSLPRPERHNSRVRLGFVGLLAHRPNRVGLLRFVKTVLPGLQSANHDGIELWVAGVGLPEDDERFLRCAPGVRLLGYVEDLTEFYTSIDVAVAPLYEGQGAPTKVIEALGHGRPVVGSPWGLRGVPPAFQERCFEATDSGWADALERALRTRFDTDWQRKLAAGTWEATFQQHLDPVLAKSA
jgi:glycosyltransferase involved in cell wall biosynthesis